MANSKWFTVLDTIATGLGGLTVAGGSNNTIKKVFRKAQNIPKLTLSELPCYILLTGDQFIEDETNSTLRATIEAPIWGVVATDANVTDQDFYIDLVDKLIKDAQDWFDDGDNHRLSTHFVVSARMKRLRQFHSSKNPTNPFFGGLVIVEYFYNKGSA